MQEKSTDSPSQAARTYLTTAQLAKATAGGRGYIRTKERVPVGLAYNLKLNPRAPEHFGDPGAIVVGKGYYRERNAKRFVKLGLAIPAYLKRPNGAWEYVGEYRTTTFREDKEAIKEYGSNREPGSVAGVLFVQPVSELEVSGGGFPDSATRKKVEAAAIKFVFGALVQEGFDVVDHQKENRGYDLLARSASSRLLIEVKGTNYSEPRFFLSRNERRCSEAENGWRLFVVCNAQTAPSLVKYTAAEMHQNFKLDPLTWECIQKKE
jgi:hypothetical protein